MAPPRDLSYHLLAAVILSRQHWRGKSIPKLHQTLHVVRHFVEEVLSAWVRQAVVQWLLRVIRESPYAPRPLQHLAYACDLDAIASLNRYYLSRMWTSRACNFLVKKLTFGLVSPAVCDRPQGMPPTPMQKYLIPGLAELLADQLFMPFVYVREGRQALGAHVNATIHSVAHLGLSLLVRSAGSMAGRLLRRPGMAYWGELFFYTALNTLLGRMFIGVNDAPRQSPFGGEGELYKVLGVTKDATTIQIQKAYKVKSLEFHPDRNAGKSPQELADSQEKFKAVNEAHTILTDSRQRGLYDAGLLRTSTSVEGPSWRVGAVRPSKMRLALALCAAVAMGVAAVPIAHLNLVMWHRGATHPGILMLRLLQSSQ